MRGRGAGGTGHRISRPMRQAASCWTLGGSPFSVESNGSLLTAIRFPQVNQRYAQDNVNTPVIFLLHRNITPRAAAIHYTSCCSDSVAGLERKPPGGSCRRSNV